MEPKEIRAEVEGAIKSCNDKLREATVGLQDTLKALIENEDVRVHLSTGESTHDVVVRKGGGYDSRAYTIPLRAVQYQVLRIEIVKG